MKKVAFILIIVLLAFSLGCLSSTSTPTTTQTSQPSPTTPSKTQAQDWLEGLDKSKFHFYVFGVNTCPHCRRMKELLPEYFGNKSLTFYEVRENKTAYEFYLKFMETLGVTGVPLIGIFYENKLYAVVEGEIDPRDIPKLVKAAMKENGVALIISRGQFLIPRNETKGIEAISNLTSWFKLGEH